MKNQTEKLRNQSHSQFQQKELNKYLGINLPKETKELYTENYKTLMKEKEYVKAVYCHPAYLTYMQNTS